MLELCYKEGGDHQVLARYKAKVFEVKPYVSMLENQGQSFKWFFKTSRNGYLRTSMSS